MIKKTFILPVQQLPFVWYAALLHGFFAVVIRTGFFMRPNPVVVRR